MEESISHLLYKKKKDNLCDCPCRGPYRARTGDLHNAIVALSHAELTAPSCIKYTQGSKQSQSESSPYVWRMVKNGVTKRQGACANF